MNERTTESVAVTKRARVGIVAASVDVIIENDEGSKEARDLIASLVTDERGWIRGTMNVQGYVFDVNLRGVSGAYTLDSDSPTDAPQTLEDQLKGVQTSDTY